jgi:hypothetical protein
VEKIKSRKEAGEIRRTEKDKDKSHLCNLTRLVIAPQQRHTRGIAQLEAWWKREGEFREQNKNEEKLGAI